MKKHFKKYKEMFLYILFLFYFGPDIQIYIYIIFITFPIQTGIMQFLLTFLFQKYSLYFRIHFLSWDRYICIISIVLKKSIPDCIKISGICSKSYLLLIYILYLRYNCLSDHLKNTSVSSIKMTDFHLVLMTIFNQKINENYFID